MKRWIVRGFFVGVLLLCVGGWVGSYKFGWSINHAGDNNWGVDCVLGTIYLERDQSPPKGLHGWIFETYPASSDFLGVYNGNYHFGFGVDIDDASLGVAIPLWFLTTILAALLWLAWRKTRAKVAGRAFPVEVGKA